MRFRFEWVMFNSAQHANNFHGWKSIVLDFLLGKSPFLTLGLVVTVVSCAVGPQMVLGCCLGGCVYAEREN